MKSIAHYDMERIVRNLDLNDAVLDLAHRFFCIYRDLRNKVKQHARARGTVLDSGGYETEE